MHIKDNISHPTVLHIASGDLWAGAEVQLFTLAKTLHCKTDTRVSVVLLNHGELEDRLRGIGISTAVLDETHLNSFNIIRQIARVIRQQRPDIVHTHRTKENILGSIAALVAGRTPSLRTAHGAPEHRPSFRQFSKHAIHFIDWLAGRFLQSKIIAVSNDLADILKKNFPSEKISVIENGLDIDTIQSAAYNADTSTNTVTDKFRIGLAGRLVPVKRVDLFIYVAKYVLDHYPDLNPSFHIFGDGPMHNELVSLSQTLKIKDMIKFEGHCINITQRIRELDVLLMTSDHEGLPMILLEAMALRTPIIAHSVGGIPNLLDYGKCGVLVHEHSAAAYAHEINRLEKHPQVCSEIEQCAYDRVTKNYTAEQNACTYITEYRQILSGIK